MRKHQVDSEFVANNSHCGSTVREERSESLVEYSVFPSANSESGSFSLIWNGTNPDSPISIPSIFPAINTDSENDDSSESNETSPRFSDNSNSIVSLFPPARSATDSPENYEIITTRFSIPSIFPAINTDSENDGSSESNETSPRFSHNSNSILSLFPPARSATDSPENYEIIITSFSSPLIFPPTISDTETNDSCSESNQSPRAQFSCSSLFPPAGSETDSSSAKNYEIILGQILPTPNLRIFTFTELKVATKNFRPDTVLGEGEFGQVFKGLLKDKGQSMSGKPKNFRPDTVLGGGGFGQVFKGWLKYMRQSKSGNRMAITVKKLSTEGLQGFQEWLSEVNLLGRLSHPNLIKLLGYCREDREFLLIYEFMPKGSLENHLFGRGSAVQPLPWDIRLKIAIGAARGLAFLHTSDKQVVYGDFKPSNILLDGSYTAKISEFGLVKLGPSASQSHVTTRVMGTYGYAAPEYIATGHLYIKSDGYGFGVVLVEILTGLRAFDTKRPSGKHKLVDWIKPYLSERIKLKQIMDYRLEGKYLSKDAFYISQLALKCLAAEPKHRPSMKEVLEKLVRFEAANERSREPRNHASHPMVHRQGQ
ncbi:putative serine/threonine-protein kinase PIX13 [Castanea sativa]|uniref:putative serine/threonine-protein kinase PIX13 n=1 Tax=Castanea sativa TaxID=21020 RepID=UPI003F652602